MSLRCPRCRTALPVGRILWFTRMFSFKCTRCGSELALTGRGRTALVGSIVATILVCLLVKRLTASDILVIVFSIAGVVAGGVVTWRIGELGIVVDEGKRRAGH
jgi:hypothetical protein